MTKYPDTEKGARDALHEMAVYDGKRGTVICDPYVIGVWAIKGAFDDPTCPDAVVYLGGYRDPFGNVREDNDFEECEVMK